MTTAITNVRIFDGEKMNDNSRVVIENGLISDKTSADTVIDGKGAFLIPGLIDAHAHVSSKKNINALVEHGVTTACTLDQSVKTLRLADSVKAWSCCTMAVGEVPYPEDFAAREKKNGADYIKVILEETPRMAPKAMSKNTLERIVKSAHDMGLLVVAHAVTVPTLQMASDAGIDIHIHVPLKEKIPQGLIGQIVEKGAYVVPTLSMMRGFSRSLIYGYRRQDYSNAKDNVKRLYEHGVPIAAGTDANNVPFLPKIKFGSGLHAEMELLYEAGLTQLDVLKSATVQAARAYRIPNIGKILPGHRADIILISGSPDKNIKDISNICKVWIGGKEAL